jgi:hypothetical protein
MEFLGYEVGIGRGDSWCKEAGSTCGPSSVRRDSHTRHQKKLTDIIYLQSYPRYPQPLLRLLID